MLKQDILKALSDQMNFELHSSYIYLGMSSYLDSIGFNGFSHWMHIQAQEEMAHAMHLYHYILQRGEQPEFKAIDKASNKFKNVLEVFEETLKHEQFITDSINKIASLALNQMDHATYQFIQWYVNEQVEEEANADLILQKLKHIGEDKGLTHILDQELKTRVFVHPFPNESGTTAN